MKWPISAKLIISSSFSSISLFFRSEEHTSELQSQSNLVCRLLLEKKNTTHSSKTNIAIGVHPEGVGSAHIRRCTGHYNTTLNSTEDNMPNVIRHTLCTSFNMRHIL